MNATIEQYVEQVKSFEAADLLPSTLLLGSSAELSTYYAPFEYINHSARVVIVGITPGMTQAVLALEAAKQVLVSGGNVEAAKLAAKATASFGGPMRKNLIRLLDFIGLPDVLGIASSSSLFDDSGRGLVHYTSVVRNPTFKAGKLYNGSPAVMSNAFLRQQVKSGFFEEVKQLSPDAIYIPLGKAPTEVMKHCVALDMVRSEQVLSGLPHPSGANAERIAYFTLQKNKDDLSAKTNPATIDKARCELVAKLKSLK